MKETIYFTGTNTTMQNLETAIKSVTDKRDIWLDENKSSIVKIDKEDIKIVPWSTNHQNVMVVIQLTYYRK